ncbi:MAG: transposase [bacterium]|nr:transposase [bacterium]
MKRTTREVFMPLVHRPGEAQVDYFFALAKIRGRLEKVAIFLMALPYSDAFFMMCTPRECTETFWEGHVRAFAFFGGVPCRISYDNSRVMVSQIIGVHARKLTDGFLELVSHYLFEHHFAPCDGPTRRAWSRNGQVRAVQLHGPGAAGRRLRRVERLPVGPMPQRSGAPDERQIRTKQDLLRRTGGRSLPLPPAPFDACRKTVTRASSLSVVRFRGNNYSVPVRYAHHEVTVKGYWDRVEIFRAKEQIADHGRLWGNGETIYDPATTCRC